MSLLITGSWLIINNYSVDQGVSAFATCFSKDDALIVGYNVAKEKLSPLMNRVLTKNSERRK